MKLEEMLPQEGVNAVVDALCGEGTTGLYDRLLVALQPYAASLAEKNTCVEVLAEAIVKFAEENQLPQIKPGVRVKVHDGTGQKYLGEGTYEGEVTVYIIDTPDGNLQSLTNAEEPPPPEMIPPGCTVRRTEDNPKIRLDNGRVVYGCQVWWSPLEETEH